ncbi:hypothetical protein Gotri_023892, partial [Gossypium trilobum]|nr:hypothetical protein [Gossypium trilobum]
TSKLKVTWTSDEDKLTHLNSKDHNTIFNGVGLKEFRRISKCATTKEAWFILKKTHEGTNIFKQSKIQMLTTIFVLDLGGKRLDPIRINELIGSLQSFEMKLEETRKRKVKLENNIHSKLHPLVTTEGDATLKVL